MLRLAVMSFHGCPVGAPGRKRHRRHERVCAPNGERIGPVEGIRLTSSPAATIPATPQIVELCEGARVIHLNAGPLSEPKETLYWHIPEFLNNLAAFQRLEGTTYDLIHSHYWLSGRVGMALSESWEAPHVTTFHTLARTKLQAHAGENEPALRLSVERQVMESADAIVVSTAQERDDLARLYHTSPHRVRIIPAGVDLELFQPVDKVHAREELGLRENKVILYVGRIEPLKGLDILLQAVAMLEDPSEARLLIVGGTPGQDKELSRLENLAVELGIADRVTFTGALNQSELPKLLQRGRCIRAAILFGKLRPGGSGGYGVRHVGSRVARRGAEDLHTGRQDRLSDTLALSRAFCPAYRRAAEQSAAAGVDGQGRGRQGAPNELEQLGGQYA